MSAITISALSTCVWLLLLCVSSSQVLAAPAAAAQDNNSTPSAYLSSKHTQFKQLLEAVSVDDRALKAMHGVLLAPSDAAVEGLAKSMGMPLQQLLANKLLVDQITAYHFLPRIKISKGLKLPNMPVLSKTAEPHYQVRFYNQPASSGQLGKAWLVDMQANKVPLKQQPVVFGNLTIVPIDKALMSGGYFASVEDALRLHAQFSKAQDLYKRAGSLPSAATADVTLFVPVDTAFESAKSSASAMSAPESRRVVTYLATTPGRSIAQLQSGTRASLLSGHSLKIDVATSGELKAPWSDKAVPKPVVTVTDEAGNKADVTLFNIWAGKSVIHGINRVLQPTTAETSLEKGTPQSAGSRKLLQSAAGSQFGDWSSNNPASRLVATNTVQAAERSSKQYANAYYALPDSPGWAAMNQWSCWDCN